MKHLFITLWLILYSATSLGQTFGVKSNLLYDVTTTFNLGVEARLAPRWTMDVSASYNPWKFGQSKKFKLWLMQPEARYWFNSGFNGHFMGVNIFYGGFNVAHIKFPFGLYKNLRNNQYQGDVYGTSIAYGYQWQLKKRWCMEATLALGYARFDFDRYEGCHCGEIQESGHKNYFGPTKVGINLIYTIE